MRLLSAGSPTPLPSGQGRGLRLRQGCNAQVLRLFLRVYGAFDWDGQVLTVQGGLPLATVLQHKNGVRRGSLAPAALISCPCAGTILQHYQVRHGRS